ncbi:hypothetical protein KC333_g8498 [Hortaea werneckii]|nr:hypothetical protein KC333_g8498 [Hortaea werneckii]KAI7304177.1 hypothetical protein KC326_g8517 [Hortaea werneckii]
MGVSGYASPQSVIGVTITFLVIAVLAVALRLWTRFFIVRHPGFDDLFIAGAVLCTIGLAICTCVEVKISIGRHIETLSPEEGIAGNKALYASIAIYNIGLLCTKWSILIQYLRIFPQKGFRVACYVMLAVCLIYASWCFWNALFFCSPVKAFWDQSLIATGEGTCFSREAVWFANAGINIVTDCIIAALPIPMLNKLNISKRQKIALMVVFALGGFTCIISVLRLVSVYAVTNTDDPTYNNGRTALWSALEINIAIICSCIPTLKSMATRFFPRIFSTQAQSEGTPPYGQSYMSGRAQYSDPGKRLQGNFSAFQRPIIGRGSDNAEIHLDQFGQGSRRDIKVVTVVDQEVEERSGESSSTRNLVDTESLRRTSDER